MRKALRVYGLHGQPYSLALDRIIDWSGSADTFTQPMVDVIATVKELDALYSKHFQSPLPTGTDDRAATATCMDRSRS